MRWYGILVALFSFAIACENTVNRTLTPSDETTSSEQEAPAVPDDAREVFDTLVSDDLLADDLVPDESDNEEPDTILDEEPSDEILDEETGDDEAYDDLSPLPDETANDEEIDEESPDETTDLEKPDDAEEMPDLDAVDEGTTDPEPDLDTIDLDQTDESIPDEDVVDLDAVDFDASDFDTADLDTADLDTVTDDGGPDVDFLDETISLIDQQNMTDIVYYLASSTCNGRNNNTTGSTNARNRLINELTDAGIEPGGANGTWTQPFAYWCGFNYIRGNNIVGFLEGSDPVLKNEFVVIGAHYDHLGTTGSTYYPGADDNASGSAALVEIAAALARIQIYLARSVVFLFFDAEEDGLCGSEYYTDHPLYTLAATVYMIDLDMVGYLRNNALELTDANGSTWGRSTLAALAPKYGLTVTFPSCGYECSDHAPFYNAGIPSLMITTGLEDVYHKTTDTADKINYAGMVTVAAYTTDFAYQVNTHIAPFFFPLVEPPVSPNIREFRDHGVLPANTPRN